MNLTLPGALRNLRWLGRGPHENYPDRCSGNCTRLVPPSVLSGHVLSLPRTKWTRCSGAALGQWACAVDDTHVPYIVPPPPSLPY